MTEIPHESIQADLCRLVGIDPGSIVETGVPSFGLVLQCLVEKITSVQDVGPYSSTAYDGPGTPEITTLGTDAYTYCGGFTTLNPDVGWTVPLKLVLTRTAGNIVYDLSIGCDLERWKKMNDAKRWELIYLMCHGDDNDQWRWSHHVRGAFDIEQDAT